MTARTATLAAGGGTFQTDNTLEWDGTIDGAGALTKTGPGALFLGADNTYAGGTTIASGQLILGTGGTTGSILGDVVDNGTLNFNRSNLYTFDGTISGSGLVVQGGTGNTVLTADNTYGGSTLIAGGGLYINGNQTASTGETDVIFGTLGGNGIIGGDVFVDAGGRLAPGGLGSTPGTLTINGSLDLADGSNLDYSFGQAGVVGGTYNDLTVVHGDLTLDGTINVTEAPGGNFGPGIYRVISYDGALTDNVLDTTSPNHLVQTSVAHQVNLIDISGQTLNFWDGNAGPKSNDVVNGGDGTWRAAGDDNWTGPDGSINAAFSNGSFAIFAGTAGLVTVDNTNGQVQAAGMQFATGGYVVQGQDDRVDRSAVDHPRRRRNPCRSRLPDRPLRESHRRHPVGEDRPWHAGACRHQHLHRRHCHQGRHAAGLGRRQSGRRCRRPEPGRWRNAADHRGIHLGARCHSQCGCRHLPDRCGPYPFGPDHRRRRLQQDGRRSTDPDRDQYLCGANLGGRGRPLCRWRQQRGDRPRVGCERRDDWRQGLDRRRCNRCRRRNPVARLGQRYAGHAGDRRQPQSLRRLDPQLFLWTGQRRRWDAQ